MILLLLLIPLLGALAVWILGNKWAPRLALLVSVAELICTIIMYTSYTRDAVADVYFYDWIQSPKISLHFMADGLSIAMLLLTNGIIPLILLSCFNRSYPNARAFFSLILFMQFALVGVFMAMDGMLYYIFWELALIPIYFIALLWGGINRIQVTFKFFIYTLGGSLLMLFGFIALYWMNPAHTFDIRDLYANQVCSCNQGWLFWMFFIAYAIKIPIVPFHTWQADTYKESPTPGTMLLSGIMLKMGLYSLIRWLMPILPSGVAEWGPLAITLSVIGIVYASIIAIMQRDLKRLFAYSSVAHVGLIAAGIFSLTLQGWQGGVVQMLSHAVNVVGLFLCADIIFNRTQSNFMDELGGIRVIAPKFATLFLIVVLGSVALPLTNGFIGEFMLLYGVYSYHTWLGVFAGLTVVLGAVYMFRMYQHTMLGNYVDKTSAFTDLKWNETLVLSLMAILIIGLGIYPTPILELTEPVIQSLLNKSIIPQ